MVKLRYPFAGSSELCLKCRPTLAVFGVKIRVGQLCFGSADFFLCRLDLGFDRLQFLGFAPFEFARPWIGDQTPRARRGRSRWRNSRCESLGSFFQIIIVIP